MSSSDQHFFGNVIASQSFFLNKIYLFYCTNGSVWLCILLFLGKNKVWHKKASLSISIGLINFTRPFAMKQVMRIRELIVCAIALAVQDLDFRFRSRWFTGDGRKKKPENSRKWNTAQNSFVATSIWWCNFHRIRLE